ncbi:hypothetical protein MAUB1S_01015 [Mycolicibacterium aubagnense]
MLDFFCPLCGDFIFETVTCLRCEGPAELEPVQVA